jgi:hypothetical protein
MCQVKIHFDKLPLYSIETRQRMYQLQKSVNHIIEA